MVFVGWTTMFNVFNFFNFAVLTRGFDFFSQKLLTQNPHPTGDSKCPITREHLDAARLCHFVYDDEYLHKSERFVDSPSTDVQCSMSVDDGTLYVVFRGSDDNTDWSHNLNMNLVEYPAKSKNKIHAGFLVQWLSVKDEVSNKVSDMIESSKRQGKHIAKVVFTGHSAGSPPACLCAKELELGINADVQVITFGSPRFSNQAFKKEFDTAQKCTRVVLDRDLVTRFPIFYRGYTHVGSPLTLRDGHVIQRETTNFEAFQWLLLGIPRLDFGVLDHLISNYVEKLESFLT